MYISKVKIQNFRCFEDIHIEFNDGLNVIIGENNSGKTTILKSLELILNPLKSKKLIFDDFYRGINIKNPKSPEITLQLTIKSSGEDMQEDLALVSSWVTKLEDPWEAQLTYIYYLPENDSKKYEYEINKLLEDAQSSNDDFWYVLNKYVPKYIWRIYGGDFNTKNKVDTDDLYKFSCELLDALRDVESELFHGNKKILRQVFNHFLDYEIKYRDIRDEEEEEEKYLELESKRKGFQTTIEPVIEDVKRRIRTQEVELFSKFTGALEGGTPEISGTINEEDIISSLQLIIPKLNYHIPISNNGLGYCNLTYISLVLSKMKMLSSDQYGDNAIIYPILSIEEPEAHLHPALQYNFLKSLSEEAKKKNNVRQIFVTTHSTHITSAVDLDSIICMTITEGNIQVAYPGKVFSDSLEDQESKHYIERFLDATKSNLLFSKSVIFVEGLAELLILPLMAEIQEKSFEQSHVAIISVDGLVFKHFVKLFGASNVSQLVNYSLKRKVACVMDCDPSRKKRNVDRARYKSCYPFELNINPDLFEYKPISDHIINLKDLCRNAQKIKIFHGEPGINKTFEYDLALSNSNLDMLFSSFQWETISSAYNEWQGNEEERIKKAYSYYQFIESKSKGENAFLLSLKIKNEILNNGNEFTVPTYIQDAINWVCNNIEECS